MTLMLLATLLMKIIVLRYQYIEQDIELCAKSPYLPHSLSKLTFPSVT